MDLFISSTIQIPDNVMKTVCGYMLIGLIVGVTFSEHSFKAINYIRIQFCIAVIAFPIVPIITNRYLTYELFRILYCQANIKIVQEAKNVLRDSRLVEKLDHLLFNMK